MALPITGSNTVFKVSAPLRNAETGQIAKEKQSSTSVVVGKVTTRVPKLGSTGIYNATYTPGSTTCITNNSNKPQIVTFPARDEMSTPPTVYVGPGGVATNTVPAELTIWGTPSLGQQPFEPVAIFTEGIPQDATGLAITSLETAPGKQVNIEFTFTK